MAGRRGDAMTDRRSHSWMDRPRNLLVLLLLTSVFGIVYEYGVLQQRVSQLETMHCRATP